MKHVLSLAASAFVSCGALAADFSFEGRWMLPSGQPGANVDSTCTLRFYSADGASSPAGEQAGVPFQTDKDGYFVVGGPVPANMPDTFWVGVKPAESDEIVPRFRVAPVPYAFAASEANLVESDKEVVIGLYDDGRVVDVPEKKTFVMNASGRDSFVIRRGGKISEVSCKSGDWIEL